LQVVKNLNLNLAKGEFLTLLGPSGCGKSTLLRCIAGLETQEKGTITLDGIDLGKLSAQERGIGMVFQNYALFPTMRVIDNVMFGLRMHRVPPDEAKKRALEALSMVHLDDKIRALPHQLSGGQQQRVALARALVLKPRLLLLDEPLSALDAQIRRSVRTDVRNLQKALGMTTILVTHDQEEAFAVSDRICLMNEGRILQEGRPQDVYQNPKTEAAACFLGNYNVLKHHELENWHWATDIKNSRPELTGSAAIAPEELNIEKVQEDGHAEKLYPVFSERLWTTGIIEDYVHLGSIRRYHVIVADKTMMVDQLNAQRAPWINSGQEVFLSVNPSSIRRLEAI